MTPGYTWSDKCNRYIYDECHPSVMIKGPLVYAAMILAALLMIISAVVILNRDLFVENSDLIMIVSGVVALGVIIVLVMILIRTWNRNP